MCANASDSGSGGAHSRATLNFRPVGGSESRSSEGAPMTSSMARTSCGVCGVYILLCSGLDDFLVWGCVEQILDLTRIGELDLHEPAGAVWIVVDLGRIGFPL